MSKARICGGLLGGLALGALRCGGGDAEVQGLVVDEQSNERISARYAADMTNIELSSTSTGAVAGDVVIAVGALTYDLHYDFAAREVVADGHAGALDRPTHALMRDVVESVADTLRPDPGQPPEAQGANLPLHEQMLYAALVLLEESGGMPLPRLVFRLDPLAESEIDKSLGNDGVTCIERGEAYAVSFDDASGTTEDLLVTADAAECNGKCGPGCTHLTPWAMWTLDCLEHDSCCDATGDPGCWTPLGQCGDEYVDAETDFLRGFDPLSSHCRG